MAHRILETERDRADFIKFISGIKLPATFEWRLGRDRSLDQNRLQYLWAREAADQRGDVSAEDVRCEWKLKFGVPILCTDSEDMRETFTAALGPMPYHLRLKTMLFVPVTSLMKVRQMVRYLDAIERECVEQGIRLTAPDKSLASYQARYRSPERRAA